MEYQPIHKWNDENCHPNVDQGASNNVFNSEAKLKNVSRISRLLNTPQAQALDSPSRMQKTPLS